MDNDDASSSHVHSSTAHLDLSSPTSTDCYSVQPPGSTSPPQCGHAHMQTGRESSDESDGTSFTDEDVEDVGAEDQEDEEDQLITIGGAGIPIGSVSNFSIPISSEC